MHPSYEDGDYLLVDQISYDFSDPKRGDVIVFTPAHDEVKVYIKRVIGLPNDKIILEDDTVLVVNSLTTESGKILKESYIEGTTKDPSEGAEIILLGEDEYFVMGDNRSNSSDSRSWGVLSRSRIIGKVLVRLWPISDFYFFKKPSYGGLE